MLSQNFVTIGQKLFEKLNFPNLLILVPEKVLPGGVKIPPGSGTKVIRPPGSTFSGSKITGTKITGI